MANQRSTVVMTPSEVSTFLTEQRSATVATVGGSGALHLVGMWYAWFDGQVWLETKAKSQKVVNLRRDPRLSFLVEAGDTYDQLRGVSLEGTGAVLDDPDLVWDVCVRVFERYTGPYDESMRPIVELMVAQPGRRPPRRRPGAVLGPPQARPRPPTPRWLHRPLRGVGRGRNSPVGR